MMQRNTMFLFILLLLHLTPPTTSSSSPQLNIWPKPIAVSWPEPTATLLSPSFHIISLHSNPYLRIAARRYTRLLLSELHHPLTPLNLNISSTTLPLSRLYLSVADPAAPLHPVTDESYSLYVPAGGGHANVTAQTPWGAMRGLETLSQMAWWEGEKRMVAAGVEVFDRPVFGHRGVLLDTARNYYPVRDVLRTVRAMAHNKMNVFHWHLTDSQSFPIELPSEPGLAGEGAYGAAMRYSPADVRRVVDYAMSFGVRVVPEIDAPGHTASWAGAYPDIITCAGKFWAPAGGDALAAEPGPGQLNPLNPKTYQVLRNIYRDVAALFPDPFLHAGADEVNSACWKADPAITSYLSSGNGTLDDLLETFINTTLPYIVSLNRTAVYWEDVLLSSAVKVRALPTETTVLQTWNNGPNNTKQLTAAGYRVIVSSADFYYLDCGHGGWVGNDSRYDRQDGDGDGRPPFNYGGGNGGSWCAPFKTWQRVYDYDITYGLSEEEARLVLGGEVALWSEQSDETVVDARLWPRAAAAAEALWSGNRGKDGRKRYAEATERLNEWRYRMVGRKIGAEPIQPLWCVRNPGMCNLVQ